MAGRFLDRWRERPEAVAWPETRLVYIPVMDAQQVASTVTEAVELARKLLATLEAIQWQPLAVSLSQPASEAPQPEPSGDLPPNE